MNSPEFHLIPRSLVVEGCDVVIGGLMVEGCDVVVGWLVVESCDVVTGG